MRNYGAVEVSAMDVYTDVFKLGSGLIQKENDSSRDMKSNPLGYYKNVKAESGHYRILFEDTFEDVLKELQEADFCILNGLTYFGRRNTVQAANRMFAMIFDLDGVSDKTLNNFLHAAINGSQHNLYPIPNYIALSGHGIHLYYVFERPVPLFPNIKLQLKGLKYALTERLWNGYTSEIEDKQFQGINQGFRVIGGKTKIPGVRVRAFRLNKQPFSLAEICKYLPDDALRIDETKLFRESRYSLEEAKALFPEWYQRRVLNGEKPRSGRWVCKRDLYDWWLRKIKVGAALHHRYFCIMCLAIYAAKCDIDEDELRADAFDLIPLMNDIAKEEPFTEADVLAALECFDERYIHFPRGDISKLADIEILPNKRNYRTLDAHLKLLNATRVFRRDVLKEDAYKNNGRPSKAAIVAAWRRNNPSGKKSACIRETGLDKKTVYKHWG